MPHIKDIPVIIMIAKVNVDNKVNPLLGGAVDYVTKPFHSKELLARKVDCKVISDKAADVFAKVNVSKLTIALSKENCEVISMQERDESLKSYYVSLVGGKNNA